MNGQGQNSK